ncbi:MULTISPECIES: hypothetical protein [Vibrio]|uniref:hypothetical protein n=1 Tax=Vibrio TaxID=662 RepID=UPI000648E3D9|nr:MULTISPECIES: hypothetical protein [Vibrio]AUL95779.1 hypothetical protein FORC54_1634 [Vibrio vulnificus]EHZ2746817.1 hypothetical protein [Vibrio vulnificus]PNG68229.1 hypothetical protein TI06_22080 [Vibrio vulnificus]
MDKLSLEESLVSTMGQQLGGTGTELAEIAIDSVLDDGVLKDIPVVGTAVSLYQTGVAVRERQYVKKLVTFLSELNKTNEEARLRFIAEEMLTPEQRERFGETILSLIDKADDNRKFELYAKVFERLFMNACSYDDAIRICQMIERTFFSDLQYILVFENGCADDQLTAGELYKVGFLSFGGLDGGTFDDKNSGGVIYNRNKYGDILFELLKH